MESRKGEIVSCRSVGCLYHATRFFAAPPGSLQLIGFFARLPHVGNRSIRRSAHADGLYP